MEELFSSNLFAVYTIACIAVIAYTNFKENQRMFLLYLFTYATSFFHVFRISYSIVLLILITFIFLEYLTEDAKKLAIIVRFDYKIYDYFYMMFFQYHLLWILISFVLLHASNYFEIGSNANRIFKTLSILLAFVGTHLSISQPFKIKRISDLCKIFEERPPYSFEYRENMQEKFDLLCEFEDKTYFQRHNSYSCLTIEFIQCSLKNFDYCHDKKRNILNKILSVLKNIKSLKRGYSTPEMQLIRTIGIVRGYEKYRISRKIFEILYSKIFFNSLKAYHKANTYLTLQHYRHYLLFIYFQTVLTKINGKKCSPLSSAFANPEDIGNWSMHGLFVACLGLSFRKVNNENLSLFNHIITKYNLNIGRIKQLSEEYPKNKFPLEDRTVCLF